MRKILIFLMIITLSGCIPAEVQKSCPSEDAVIPIQPYGIPVLIPKGYFDTPEGWMPYRLFEEEMKRPKERS